MQCPECGESAADVRLMYCEQCGAKMPARPASATPRAGGRSARPSRPMTEPSYASELMDEEEEARQGRAPPGRAPPGRARPAPPATSGAWRRPWTPPIAPSAWRRSTPLAR